jgi:hypothetical protein
LAACRALLTIVEGTIASVPPEAARFWSRNASAQGLAGQLRLNFLRGAQMLEHDRQGVGRESDQLEIPARADFVLEELRGPLMVRHRSAT